MADFLSLVGILVFGALAWHFAQIQLSVLDEGLYLYKGWLFASGRYTPFQAYGPWTNQMPLAFLIPGWVQVLFGAGLRTGRSFAVLLDLFMALGLWLTARRLGGRWIALGVVWALALNPAAERMYAEAASQGLAACLLAWTMFFGLGDERPNWQLVLSGALAGAVVMVRINLLLLLPLLALYVLWARGWTSALWLLGGELLTFGGVHLAYWPNILQLWAKWLPFPFLKPWFPPKNLPTWNPDNPLGYRVASFFLAFRFHFAAMVGALTAWILWPKRWKSGAQYKAAVFLSLLFLAFVVLHAWAALGNEYCVFCFPTYTSFYAGVGLILVALTLPSWRWDVPRWRRWTGGLALLCLLGGMAYSAEGTVADLLGASFYKRLLALPVPGFRGAQLWQIVANKFRLAYGLLYDTLHAAFPVCVALAFGLALFLAVRWLWGRKNSGAYGALAFVLLLGLGTLLSPSRLLAGEYNTYDCASNVMSGYEAAGAQLAKVIPAGARVYWADYSPVTLLYLPQVRIYPAQLHLVYSFRIGSDDDALAKYGWWNQSLAAQWIHAADYVLVDAHDLNENDWLAQTLSGGYEKVTVTAPQAACQSDSALYLFRRK